jgi:cephalosporin-C deacetylase
MPLTDMPLEKLKTYQGRNPKPADFDAYWDRGLAEMRATEPNATLVPADIITPTVECFDLYFTGVRGARIHAKYARPIHHDGPLPVVLQFHGYSGNSGDWIDKIAYAACGFAIASLDCRGQAGESEDVGGVKGNTLNGHIIRGLDDETADNLLFRHMFLDTAQMARVVLDFPETDDQRVGAFGGSQGGGLTLACASLEPRVKRLAPVFPFLSDYQRVWEMDLAINAYDELKKYFRMFDPTHEREEEIFTRLGYIDVQHLAPRIRGEVLMGTGLMDNICPPSTQFAAFNKITTTKHNVIYPDFGHENLPGFSTRTLHFMLGL